MHNLQLEQMIKRIWSLDGILVDKNNDGVVDGVSLYVQLEKHIFPVGLLDFFARVGYETTALSFNHFEKKNQKYTLRFVESEALDVYMNDKEIVIDYASIQELNEVLTEIATSGIIRKKDALIPEIHSLADIWNVSGFGYAHEASPYRELSIGINIDSSIMNREIGEGLCYFIARASLLSTQFTLPIMEKEEAMIQLYIVEDDVNKIILQEKNRLQIQGTPERLPLLIQQLAEMKTWSEGGSLGSWEQKLKQPLLKDEVILHKTWKDISEVEKIERVLEKYSDDVEAFDVYISRAHRTREQLKKRWEEVYNTHIREVYSSFKTAFHWFEEQLIPTYRSEKFDKIVISVIEEKNKDGLELPIRWIQEIYPVDLLIEKEWGLSKDAVQFECQEEQDATYIVKGERNGEHVLLGQLNVPIMKIDYVDEGKYAYPSTSAVVMRMKDGSTKTELIDTDRYSFYRFYVEEVLPSIKEQVRDYQPGQGHTRPFFDRVEIDVWLNEDERKLGLDEERVSSLEALHEDLYFNTLDYFAYWGEKIEGKPFNAPGGVLPFMHISKEDNPTAEVNVYRWHDDELPSIRTTELKADANGVITEAVINRNEERLVRKVEAHHLEVNHLHPTIDDYLKKNSYSTIVTDYSYRGHQIPTIECFLPTDEQFESPIKMTMQKKTIIIEAGHHANEVSSTPAVIKVIQDLTEEVLKEVNVVVIPFANIDGYELLIELMKEHPEWKHHAARYNAVGLEYSYVRFNKSVFGEGNVMPNLLRRWAADVIVDDHGIPSHEWVQPFAGYNSPPRFPVSYFLPSAKMYGIGKLSTTKKDALQKQNLDAVIQVVSDEIGKTSISKMNDYWRSRYRKYGNDWLPDVFLLELAEHLNFYISEVDMSEQSYHAIARYPQWVAADIITEAADEIVYGDVLDHCIEAQYVFNHALIRQLVQTQGDYEDPSRKIRQRPLQLTNKLKEGE